MTSWAGHLGLGGAEKELERPATEPAKEACRAPGLFLTAELESRVLFVPVAYLSGFIR